MRTPFDPEFRSFTTAIMQARKLAHIGGASQVVLSEIVEGRLVFYVFLTESYAAIREKGQHKNIAPVASALPDGTITVYHPFKELENHVREMQGKESGRSAGAGSGDAATTDAGGRTGYREVFRDDGP